MASTYGLLLASTLVGIMEHSYLVSIVDKTTSDTYNNPYVQLIVSFLIFFTLKCLSITFKGIHHKLGMPVLD